MDPNSVLPEDDWFAHEAILKKVEKVSAIRNWFRDYKILDGEPANEFGLGDKPANKEYALKVIAKIN